MRATTDAYVRVSRVNEREGGSFISPAIQREHIQHHADVYDIDIAEWHEDLDQTGSSMSRPAFDMMMARIEAHHTGGVIVARLDRFGRSLVGSLAAMERIDAVGGTFASATERFDTSTPMGRAMLRIMLTMAEFELERIRDAWAVAGISAVGRGIHISPTVPYGYDKNDAKGEDKRLVPNTAAQFVTHAFEMRADGLPFQRIADWLNEHAPPHMMSTRKGMPLEVRRWTPSSVTRMIRRRVYLGVAFWGEHENVAAHPPLVTDELWHSAQRRVPTHDRNRQTEDVALLHGVVRCAGCRFQMSRALNTSGGRQRQYYRCRVQRVSGVCGAPAAVRADSDDGLEAYIERVVIEELDRRAATFVGLHDTNELATALSDLRTAAAVVERFRQDTDGRTHLGDRWLSWLEPLLQAENAAHARVTELRAHRTSISGLRSDAYREASRSERAEILRALIHVVFVRSVGGPRGRYAVPLDHHRVQILWRGQGSKDLPSPNRVSTVVPWVWPSAET